MVLKGITKAKESMLVEVKSEMQSCALLESMDAVHKDRIPTAQTVSWYYYTEILQRPRKQVIWVHPNIAKAWNLHHDNVLAHAALSVWQHFTPKCIMVLPQRPYSLDLAHCGFLNSKSEICSEMTPFSINKRCPKGCNTGLK
jgi:hypothetical protein